MKPVLVLRRLHRTAFATAQLKSHTSGFTLVLVKPLVSAKLAFDYSAFPHIPLYLAYLLVFTFFFFFVLS